METTSWGRFPRTQAEILVPTTVSQAAALVGRDTPVLARGLGRSYGDSALAPHLVDVRALDHLLEFDPERGEIRCEAGVSLEELERFLVPRGWFLPVVPGTRFVTVGGAIASDIHGKNHHVHGTFGQHVLEMDIVLGSGNIVTTSPTRHSDLFDATCGGMGLTGIILSARIRLLPIRSSQIVETSHKARNLAHVLELFEQFPDPTYSVAWIDCVAGGDSLGRSILMLGEHADDGPLAVQDKPSLPIPVDFPPQLMNPFTMGLFNTLYYGKERPGVHTRRKSIESYFHPLDSVSDWNRAYGKAGFLQYQFVVPFASGRSGLSEILGRIARSGKASFLAVLKVFGPENRHLISFPSAGYTLALDFKVEPDVFPLLDDLDKMVLEQGGRIYLTKDARMSPETFRKGYPRWEEFEAVRESYGAIGKFSSLQSRRLRLG